MTPAPGRRPVPPRAGCVVVGGGVAGVAAALDAAALGWRPVLLERGRVLGGMARSHADTRLGGDLDCGQHVVLGCCTAHRALLRRLGTEHLLPVQPRLDVLLVDESGRRARLAETPLPAPLHLGSSLARMPFLGTADRAAIGAAVLRLLRLRDVDVLDELSFATWLGAAARGAARRAFWDLVCVATCNLPASQLSAAVGAFVLREGFLRHRHAAAVGVPATGLSRLLEPAADLVVAAGGSVLLGEAVAAVAVEDGAVRGVRTASGATIEAPRVVIAGPPSLLARVAPEVARHPEVAPALELGTSPIVNLVLQFDRPVLEAPLLAVWDSPLQWLFSRTRAHGGDAEQGEVVVCSLSAAHDLVDLPGEAVVERLLPHLRRAQPRTGTARLLTWRVTRERRATAALGPGSRRMRLGARTPVRGLVLAGAWTATGWPITMESAARSGAAAVAALVDGAGGETRTAAETAPDGVVAAAL